MSRKVSKSVIDLEEKAGESDLRLLRRKSIEEKQQDGLRNEPTIRRLSKTGLDPDDKQGGHGAGAGAGAGASDQQRRGSQSHTHSQTLGLEVKGGEQPRQRGREAGLLASESASRGSRRNSRCSLPGGSDSDEDSDATLQR
jgi:hypothetical protein